MIDIFHGEATPQRAMLYARAARDGIPPDATLRGTVSGPECSLAETLPSKAAFRDLGEGETLLAAAAIPDPVYWSPMLPASYRVRVELVAGGEVIASEERLVGIRSLGISGNGLRLQAKRIVLRMIHQGEAPHLPVSAWREADASMLAFEPADELCEAASDAGVMMAVLVQGTAEEVAAKLKHFARHAAVAIAVIDGNLDTPADLLRNAAPNMLLFQPVSPDDATWKPAAWAKGIMAPVVQPATFALAATGCELPILAARPAGPADDLAGQRAACDALQRDLAPYCQCAGYIV